MRLSGGPLSGTRGPPTPLSGLGRPGRPSPLLRLGFFSAGYLLLGLEVLPSTQNLCHRPFIVRDTSTYGASAAPCHCPTHIPGFRTCRLGHSTTSPCHLGAPFPSPRSCQGARPVCRPQLEGLGWDLGPFPCCCLLSSSTFDLGRCHLWDPRPGTSDAALLCSLNFAKGRVAVR